MFKFVSGVSGRWAWRSLFPLFTAAAACFIIFFWHLANLTPGLSANESLARADSSSLKNIYQNPLNAPHKLLQFLMERLEPGHIGFLRLPSVIFGLIFCFCFYKLATHWFGRAIGLFSTLAFASLPLLMISSRQASSEVLFFAPVVFIWLYAWLLKEDSNKAAVWPLMLVSAAIFIYTPGLLLWMAGAFILARKRIIDAIYDVPVWISALGFVFISANVLVIVLAGIKHPALFKTIALLPANFDSLLGIFKSIGWMLLALFVKTGTNNTLALGHLPILNILLLALLVFGAYAMQGAARLKAISLGLSILFAVLAAGLNNNIAYLALGLPAAAVFIAAGLRYLYIEWRSIFPRNPVPKTFALALIALVSLSQFYFGLRYALDAWPHSEATQSAYVLK